jgi:DNA-binding PadR family transcriptional regulator
LDNSRGEKPMNESIKGYSPKDIETRIVKNFLDILILVEMKKQSGLSGYDVISFINSKFGGMLSPGTVYSTLYSLDRKGLISGVSNGKKTVYKLTEIGETIVNVMMSNFNEEMAIFARKFLTL